jgi:hypothetical protein
VNTIFSNVAYENESILNFFIITLLLYFLNLPDLELINANNSVLNFYLIRAEFLMQIVQFFIMHSN